MDAFDAYRARPGLETRVALLEAHQDAVYSLCYQVLRHSQDAQDAAQQVLLSLIDTLPRISDGAHLRQWLHRAAFHVSLDLKKTAKRRREREARVATMDESRMPNEAADEVQLQVSRLGEELRTLVVEHYFEQRPLADLAAERRVSTVAVWKKLERAREQLRGALTRAGYASALPGLDVFLASLRPVPAPEGLLTKAMMAKAAAAAVAGGIAVKLKIISAAALLVLGSGVALGFAVVRQREERRRLLDEQQEAARARPRPADAAAQPVTPVPIAPEAPAAEPAEPQEPVVVFKTPREMTDAFRKACMIREDAARWKELRRIGFLRTNAQFRKVELDLRAKVGSEEFEKSLIVGVLKEWAQSDFKGYFGFMMRMPTTPSVTKQDQLKEVLLMSLPLNREAVAATARGLSEEEGRAEILKALSILEPQKPEAVLAMAPGPKRVEALQQLIGDWAGRDPRAAARWIEQLPGAMERSEAGRLLADAWGEKDPAAAARFLQKLPGPEPAEAESRRRWLHMMAVLGRRWALSDPSAALEWADRLKGDERTEILIAMSGALVSSIISNPKEALSVIDRIPEARRAEALYGVVDAWVEIDPRAALEFARSHPLSAEMREAVLNKWAHRDSEALLSWAKSLPEGADRDAALQELARSGAGRALEAAREIRDAGRRDRALEAVAQQWSAKDLDKAIALTSEILDPVRRSGAQGSLAGSCASRDPAACRALLDRMADAGKAEHGAFAQGWARIDGKAAVAWASGLSRPELQEWSLLHSFPHWAHAEPEAARAWLERAELSDGLRQKLLKLMPAKRRARSD